MRLFLIAATLALTAGCTDEEWSGEHHPIGALSIVVTGAGSISTRTWNASATCDVDPDGDSTTTTCAFPLEDDTAEIVLAPLDAQAAVEFQVSACGKLASDDVVEARGNGIALRPHDVLVDVGCPTYPVRIEAKIAEPLPDDGGSDADDDAAVDDAGDADEETGG